MSLSVISNDTLLKKYLPYASIPHVVWIDRDGKIAAITSSDHVTASNIEKLIAGAALQLPVKTSSFDYDPQNSLVAQVPDKSTIYFQSSTVGYIPNAKSNIYGSIEVENGLEKNYFINMKLLNLLQIALDRISANRFMIKTKNPEQLIPSEFGKQEPKLYSYEIIHPKGYNKSIYLRQLFNDIGTASGLDIKLEPVTMDCYVLQKTAADILLKTKGGKPSLSLPKTNKPQLILTNQPISRLVKVLNTGGVDAPIVIDETALSSPVDLVIKVNTLKDFKTLNKGLLPYGLTLEKDKRTINMVVIRDADTARYLSPKTESL
ncbi:hypothetical protein [Niabella ginsengisoli]|uniref:Uncharacterized protein n=1 Tax=Niabella ginsengisoli TaxID=522298 RepID=A0ABS9SM89_9BACT|nr:hypothetical protein [Niabella ginsengisoli]MCH5599504.1 hypothetical protein [Niabella ginsengisoli]